ncbi:MAG TPA: peptide chain release factor N(5)-glutamine methyltransferase [Dehalococcoidales bacterium]|nr:peptide chain release factor N(5)-glutamine methyltransferase [Dehalococcoidales bacterium]
MNLKQALAQAAVKLSSVTEIDSPVFEAEILLRQILNFSRADLHSNLDQELSSAQTESFFRLVARRLQGEPAAYIIGRREFFGLEFWVDKRVLIPRPETELLVEETLRILKQRPVKVIADTGTGSGAIAVTLAVQIFRSNTVKYVHDKAGIRILALDISPEALEVARFNARAHSVEKNITFLQGDLLESLPEPADIILANLPYVPSAEVSAMISARFEPPLALDGGVNGLDQIFRLADRLEGKTNPGACLLLEIGAGQSAAVTGRLRSCFPGAIITVLPDLAGIERVVKVQLA